MTSSNGYSVHVYCEMTKSCGNLSEGLTRVAVFNNETRPLICTGDFQTFNNNTRFVRNTEDPGCSHIIFPLMNISYSHVCGIVELLGLVIQMVLLVEVGHPTLQSYNVEYVVSS